MGKFRQLGLRTRTFLFFVLLAVSVVAVEIAVLSFIPDHFAQHGDLHSSIMLFGLGSVVLILLMILIVAVLFDRNVAAPIQGVVRDVETVIHGNTAHSVDVNPGRYLANLPETVQSLAEHYSLKNREIAKEIEKATQETRKQQQTLEAVLKDLFEGVIICNLNNQILLYNQRALSLLHISGDLGLGRSLFSVIDSPPLMHSLRRLRNRLAENRHHNHPEGLSTSFVCATQDGRFSLEARMTLVLEEEEEIPRSYILTFEDVTAELTALGKRDHVLRDATEGMRAPVANIRAASEMLVSTPDVDADMRQRFYQVLHDESGVLAQKLDRLAQDYYGLATGHWPMADIYSANLLSLLALRLNDEEHLKAVMIGIPVWLHGDSHSLLLAFDQVVRNIAQSLKVQSFDLQASTQSGKVHVDVVWEGPTLSSAEIDSWLDVTLKDSIGGMSLRDVLEHHRCEMWSEGLGQGQARLRIPMLPARRPIADRTSPELPARPEFYDFSLLEKSGDLAGLGDRPLKSLTFVVFDTETTGLHPSKGDEIIALGGVRILNGRILTGESFARLVNPGRKIPKSSIKFHGITDDMVCDKPPCLIVLPQFKEFVQDAVLVAHNAAFDMKFLELKQDECGVVFDNPVLDTLLLSVFLHDHTGEHSLDDIAKRFGIEIEGRHTAIGDALVTAGIFVRMIAMLEARGVKTLNEAIAISREIVEVRAQQADF